jgi:hypothetical protein
VELKRSDVRSYASCFSFFQRILNDLGLTALLQFERFPNDRVFGSSSVCLNLVLLPNARIRLGNPAVATLLDLLLRLVGLARPATKGLGFAPRLSVSPAFRATVRLGLVSVTTYAETPAATMGTALTTLASLHVLPDTHNAARTAAPLERFAAERRPSAAPLLRPAAEGPAVNREQLALTAVARQVLVAPTLFAKGPVSSAATLRQRFVVRAASLKPVFRRGTLAV